MKGAGVEVAVVAPDALVGSVRDALVDAGLGDRLGSGATALDAPLVVLGPRDSKGLEFDAVVLLEPADVLAGSPGDLYVAMTRPTQALRVVTSRPLPAGFDEA